MKFASMPQRIITSQLFKLSYNSLIKISTYNSSTRNSSETPDCEEWANAKPYSNIPGPKPFSLSNYGNIWQVTPFGKFYRLSSLDAFKNLLKKHGNIVKLQRFGRRDIVIVSDPNAVEKVYRSEGPCPLRSSLYVLDYYQKRVRPDVFKGNQGLTTLQGEEWRRYRTAVNHTFTRKGNFQLYQRAVEEVTDDFVDKMKRCRNEKLELPHDFANEIRKWSLEVVGLIAFDDRLGCLDDNFSSYSEEQMLLNAIKDFPFLVYELECKSSLWRYFPTKNWSKFVKAMNILTNTTLKKIKLKREELAERPTTECDSSDEEETPSILEVLIKQSINTSLPAVMAIDSLISGVEPVSITVANILYHLSKNPENQQKLYQELKELIPNKYDELPKDFQTSARYLKACFKEAMRLSPVVAVNQRDTLEDIVLSGYQIPKNTQVYLFTQSLCMDDSSYFCAKKFIPERWMDKTSSNSARNAHPFTYLPFGHGPRMCIGRRLAELMGYVGIAKIIRNFKVKYNYGEMTYGSHILLYPSKPLEFRLDDRED